MNEITSPPWLQRKDVVDGTRLWLWRKEELEKGELAKNLYYYLLSCNCLGTCQEAAKGLSG